MPSAPTRSKLVVQRGMVLAGVLLAVASCTRQSGSDPLPMQPDGSALPARFQEVLNAAETSLRRAPQESDLRFDLARLYHANRFWEQADVLYAQILARDDNARAAQIVYYRADVAREQGRLEAAAQRLEETLRRRPDYLPARLSLATVLTKQGRPDEARAHFLAVPEAQPGHSVATLALARDHLLRNEAGPARTLLEQLIEQPRASQDALYLLAQIVDRSDEHLRAQQLRERAASAQNPPLIDPWMNELRAWCYDPQRWSIWFEDERWAGRGREALPFLERIEELAPESPLPHLQRAAFAREQGDFAAAVYSYQQAAKRGGEPSLVYPQWVAVLLKLNRADDARAVAAAGLAVAPQLIVLQRHLAQLEIQSGHVDRAAGRAHMVLALDPNDVELHQMMVRAYLREDRLPDAQPHLEALVQLLPQDADARRLLAQLLLQQQALDEALTHLNAVHALAPEDEEAALLIAQVQLLRARQAQDRRDASAALTAVNAALRVQPGLTEALELRVALLVESGDLAAAETEVRRLRQRYPNNGHYLVALGQIQREGGQAAAAIATWEQALAELLPEQVQLRPVLLALIREVQAPSR